MSVRYAMCAKSINGYPPATTTPPTSGCTKPPLYQKIPIRLYVSDIADDCAITTQSVVAGYAVDIHRIVPGPVIACALEVMLASTFMLLSMGTLTQ